jgi:hypothetical protein
VVDLDRLRRGGLRRGRRLTGRGQGSGGALVGTVGIELRVLKEGLEDVRKRPWMYIGDTATAAACITSSRCSS